MIFRIDLKIFLFLILFYFTRQIEIYAIVMLFAIIHEFAHLITGIFLKMKIQKITLMPVGLSVEFNLTKEDCNETIFKLNKLELKKIIIAMAGPFINILIIIIVKLLNTNSYFYKNIIYANLLIAIFNLLPIYPLDGGRILKSVLNLILNKVKADIYTNNISNIMMFFITFLFSILIYYLKNIAILFILIYLWYIVIRENKIYKMKMRLYQVLKYL